jgi:hypothetical protein
LLTDIAEACRHIRTSDDSIACICVWLDRPVR